MQDLRPEGVLSYLITTYRFI